MRPAGRGHQCEYVLAVDHPSSPCFPSPLALALPGEALLLGPGSLPLPELGLDRFRDPLVNLVDASEQLRSLLQELLALLEQSLASAKETLDEAMLSHSR